MSQNFPNESAAANYALGHDDEAKRLSRRSDAYLAVEEGRALRESGGQRIAGGPHSRDEKIASILELRWPLIAEARAMLAVRGEEPEEAAPGISDEDILRLVQADGSSDYNEGVGEHGGYVDWNVEKDVLTVTVRLYTAEADDDPSGPIVRKWKLTRVEAQ